MVWHVHITCLCTCSLSQHLSTPMCIHLPVYTTLLTAAQVWILEAVRQGSNHINVLHNKPKYLCLTFSTVCWLMHAVYVLFRVVWTVTAVVGTLIWKWQGWVWVHRLAHTADRLAKHNDSISTTALHLQGVLPWLLQMPFISNVVYMLGPVFTTHSHHFGWVVSYSHNCIPVRYMLASHSPSNLPPLWMTSGIYWNRYWSAHPGYIHRIPPMFVYCPGT